MCLTVYVRYIHERHLEEEFLFCSPLTTRTTAKEIFNFVNKFFGKHNLKWKHVIGVCTDGASAMLCCRSDFQTLFKEKSPGVSPIENLLVNANPGKCKEKSPGECTHCTIHR